ncbi:MAG: hypothetical protein WCJ72_03500 [Chryseobacterium sp.]
MNFKEWLRQTINLSKTTKLYHATPYMMEIENSGFKTKRITNISTFGSAGANDEDTISLTPNFENARNYAEAIKLVVEIAHNIKNLHDLPEIIKKYKPFNIKYYYEQLFHEVRDILSSNGKEYKISVELTEMFLDSLQKGNWQSYLNTLKDVQFTQKESQEILMSMTLALGTTTQGRFPWFLIKEGRLNAINIFKKTSPSNVGIIQTFIKDQDFETEYLVGEQEVRIPPENLEIYGFIHI